MPHALNTKEVDDHRAYRAGHALPAWYYLSQDMYEVDLDVFFHKHWTLVGFVAEIPEPGDIKKVDVGRSSLILVRDDDEKIGVFHNVCRHRGAQLVADDTASVGRIICPYHQWSYDLNGDLVHAREMGVEFDRQCHGLKTVNTRVVAGMIFICIAGDAPEDIDVIAESLERSLAPFQLDKTKVAHSSVIIEDGNWKLSVDNNRECYHCEGSHPELCNTLIGMDIGFDPAELNEADAATYNKHVEKSEAQIAKWEAQGFQCAANERYEGHDSMMRSQRFVLEGEGESHTLTGKAAVKTLLGDLEDPKLGDLHIHTFNAWHHVFADHAVLTYILPISSDRTSVHTVWLVNANARAGIDYDHDTLIEVWTATNRQDAELVRMAQNGVQSTGYEPGPLSPFTERTLGRNLQWYIERLRAHEVDI